MFVTDILAGSSTAAIMANAFDVADAGHASGVEQLDVLNARFERGVRDAEATSAAARTLIEEIRSGAKDLDGVSQGEVDALLRDERRLDEARHSLVTKALANEAVAAESAPHLLPALRRMRALLDRECRLYMEAARDLRWEALAYLASREPSAGGAILGNAEDVGAFFEDLRADG